MNIARIAGYAVVGTLAGLGVIVAAPVFGAVGVVTAVGAAIGGIGGAAVGSVTAYATDDEDEIAEAERRGHQAGENAEKAKFAGMFDELATSYNHLKRYVGEQQERNKLTLAMFAVGVACLARCGAASADNVLQVKEFAFGAAHQALPLAILDDIAQIENNPPNLRSVHARARKVALEARELMDQMVELAANIVDTNSENGLVSAWTELRAA